MYLFAVLLFALFALLEVATPRLSQRYRSVFAFIAFSFLVFHDGFRWETGTDWQAYYDFFQDVIYMTKSDIYFEAGFFYLVQLLRVFTEEYTVYLVIHAVIFYVLVFYTIFRISSYPFLTLLLFYMTTVPYMGMNRQFLAIAIFFLGLWYLTQGKHWAFFLLILVGAFFHKSIICCLPLPLLTRRYNNYLLGGLLLLSLAISFSGVIKIIAPSITLLLMEEKRSDTYLAENIELSTVVIIVSLVRKLIWIVLLSVYERAVVNKSRTYYLFFNMYFISILLYVICNGTPLQFIISRLLIYYGIAEIFILPYLLTVFKPLRDRMLLIVLFTGYAWLTITKGFSNYGEFNIFEPYKGVFINTDYVRPFQL